MGEGRFFNRPYCYICITQDHTRTESIHQLNSLTVDSYYLKIYNQHLEIAHMNAVDRNASLYAIFKRDIEDNNAFIFRGKRINPIKGEDIPMQTLFRHLTTVIVDQATRSREFEIQRSIRLHWIKFHIDEVKKEDMMVFSVQDTDGIRTYIVDIKEKYVIILAPYRNREEYYLLTAYYLDGRNIKKIESKYKRRLPELV